eukprot:scaffold25347_cov86-Skeletonema_dohrnii-CCMP3373.AAC.4
MVLVRHSVDGWRKLSLLKMNDRVKRKFYPRLGYINLGGEENALKLHEHSGTKSAAPSSHI